MDKGYILADDDWKKDIGYGIFIGVLFVFINLLIPEFRIGVPQAALGLVVLLAPIAEEFAFRGFILGFFNNIFKNFYIANILQAILFSLFHWSAYGMGLQAAFIGAGIFGIIAGYVALKRNSIVPCIVMHGIFNLWIITARMVFIGG